jgi:hypothetical protein
MPRRINRAEESVFPVMSAAIELGPPSKSLQRCASVRLERYTFRLQANALLELRPHTRVARADSSLGIDDPLPRHARVRRERMQGVTDQTRLAGKTGKSGYISIGGDFAGWNPPNDGIDAVVSTLGLVHFLRARRACDKPARMQLYPTCLSDDSFILDFV